MDRRTFLRQSALGSLIPAAPRLFLPVERFRRCRPSDVDWPSAAAWGQLRDEVDGNLSSVEFPLESCIKDVDSTGCKDLLAMLKNPYYIGDQAGLTQTLGWIDAWFTKPSVYVVAARNPNHISAAVNFARRHNLRLVIKGGGHSYQGTSNAPDSLLVWTRHMQDITLHKMFLPQGCERTLKPQRAVSCGAGAVWMQAYDAVTTKAGAYVQGGGCTTVGVAGLVQSGGFGNFSKHYGTAASGLLEAEVITADGKIRIANSCMNPDLFWAIKGGGGGSFGVVSRVTLRVRELPEFFGSANLRIAASSDGAFRRLVRQFVGFYRDHLFNDRWGESVYFSPHNTLGVSMVYYGLRTEEAKKIWGPFIDWVKRSPGEYSLPGEPAIESVPARAWWDIDWRREHNQKVFVADSRLGASPTNVWWTGDSDQVASTIYAYDSLWLTATLLDDQSPERLASGLFAGWRYQWIHLHFNNGLAGRPTETCQTARDTASNPALINSFALAIVSAAAGGYPGVRDHEPDVAAARKSRDEVSRCMNALRAVVSTAGAYVAEGNFFERDWQHSYWGSNYERLLRVKRKYDPGELFFVHNGVGSEGWSPDGFEKS